MRRTIVATTAAAMLITLASGASAAPDRSLVLSRDSRTASWTSEVHVGKYTYSSPPTEPVTHCLTRCDETLIKLGAPGVLQITVTQQGPLTSKDFYYTRYTLYRSDAAGHKIRVTDSSRCAAGQPGSCWNSSAGFYLFEVEWEEGVGSYSGTATLTPTRPR